MRRELIQARLDKLKSASSAANDVSILTTSFCFQALQYLQNNKPRAIDLNYSPSLVHNSHSPPIFQSNNKPISKMATLLLRPLLRPQTLGLGLGLSLATYHVLHQRPLRLDNSPVSSGSGVFSSEPYSRNARTPVVKGGHLNPGAVRQISSGSIIGMLFCVSR